MPNWFNRSLTLPKVKHSTFDMSNNLKTSFKIGQLVPVNLEECLPSDKFLSISQEVSIRFAPLLYPIMHGIKVHTSNFFVPFRILMGDDRYKSFLNNEFSFTQLTIKKIGTGSSTYNPFVNSIFDYLTYDVSVATSTAPTETGGDYEWQLIIDNPLPYLSYLSIIRDWYIDSNVQSQLFDEFNGVINYYFNSAEAGLPYTINIDSSFLGAPNSFQTFDVSYSKDYFNTARPQPELGSEMYVLNRPLTFNSKNVLSQNEEVYSDSTKVGVTGRPILSLTNATTQETSINEGTTIRDLWRKEMLQQYYQIDNKFGSRIREKLAGHFGVLYSDNRIQIPRYLGGSSNYVKVAEVVQTSSTTSTSPQGSFVGKAGCYAQTKKVKYYCEEHGYFLTLVSLIPDNGYCNG